MSTTEKEIDFLVREARTARNLCFGALSLNFAIVGLYFSVFAGDVFFESGLRDYFLISITFLNFIMIYTCYSTTSEITDFVWKEMGKGSQAESAPSYEYEYHAGRLRAVRVTLMSTIVPYVAFALTYNIPFWPRTVFLMMLTPFEYAVYLIFRSLNRAQYETEKQSGEQST